MEVLIRTLGVGGEEEEEDDIIYIYIYIDTTLVELHPDPCFSQIRDVEDFEDPPEIHEALFLKVFAKTKRS